MERKKKRPGCKYFLRTDIWILFQSSAAPGDAYTLEATRQEYHWQRRSENLLPLQHPAAGFRWRAKWHDESQESGFWCSYGRIDCDSTGQWEWDAKNPLWFDWIRRYAAANYENQIGKRSVTAGRGGTYSDVCLRYFQNDNIESERLWTGLLYMHKRKYKRWRISNGPVKERERKQWQSLHSVCTECLWGSHTKFELCAKEHIRFHPEQKKRTSELIYLSMITTFFNRCYWEVREKVLGSFHSRMV